MVAALALGERENDYGTREYGTCEYGTREYGTCEYGTRGYVTCEYGAACEYGTREYGTREHGACEHGACEYDREPYSQNTFKTGHFALATLNMDNRLRSLPPYVQWPRSLFQTYSRLSHTIDIRLGDDTIVKLHKGLVQVQNHWVKALHLPTFRYSLLSVGDLDTHGYSTTFEKGRCIISDPANQRMIMLGRKNGMLYELDAGSSVLDSQHTALITSNGPTTLSIAESRMWHRRLGHPGEAAIKPNCQRLRRRRPHLRGMHPGKAQTEDNPRSSPVHHYTIRVGSFGSVRTIRCTLGRRCPVLHCLHR